MWVERVFSLVCTLVCLRVGFLGTACFKNDFVDGVARLHGGNMSVQRFQVRSCSLPLHGSIFHRWRRWFAWIWSGTSTARPVRVDLDRCGDNHWRYRTYLHAGTYLRSLQTEQTRCGLSERRSFRVPQFFGKLFMGRMRGIRPMRKEFIRATTNRYE
jgi:hypothetical protein